MYESGACFSPDVLDITKEDIMARFVEVPLTKKINTSRKQSISNKNVLYQVPSPVITCLFTKFDLRKVLHLTKKINTSQNQSIFYKNVAYQVPSLVYPPLYQI